MISEKVGKSFVNITFYHAQLRVDVRFEVKQEDCWLLILIAITQGASWKKLSLILVVKPHNGCWPDLFLTLDLGLI